MRGEEGDKRRHPINGMLKEIVTFIKGCGNGHLEGVRNLCDSVFSSVKIE